MIDVSLKTKQTITIPLGTIGMDAGKDPKIHPGLLRVENGRYVVDGSISKRTGCVMVDDGYQVDSFIGVKSGNPIIHSVPGIYLAEPGDPVTLSAYMHPMLDVAVTGLAHSRSDVFHYCDIGSNGSITGLAYTSRSGASYYITVEGFLTDGLIPVQGGGGNAVTFGPFTGPRTARILCLGTTLFYYYFDDSGILRGGTFSGSGYPEPTPSVYSAATAALTTVYEWDACTISQGSGYVMMAYAGATAGKAVLLSLPAGLNTGAICLQIDNASHPVSLPAIWKQSAATVAVAYVLDDTTWKLTAGIYEYDTDEILAPTTLDSIVKATYTPHAVTGCAESTTRSAAYWDAVASNIPHIRYREFTTGGAVGSVSYLAHRARLAWKPALSARPNDYGPYPQHFVGVFFRSWGYDHGAQDSIVMLLSGAPGVPAAKVLLGTARTGDSYGMLPNMQTLVGTATESRWLTVAERLTQLDNVNDNKGIYHLGQVVIDFDQLITSCVTHEAGRGRMIIPGACPLEYDGADVYELGFIQYPEPIGTAGTSGGSMAPGTYRYRLVYEWTDANGTRHLSAPSPEYNEITLVTDTAVIVTCPTLTLTTKSGVQIAVYRTIVNTGTAYYRVGTVANNRAANTVTYTDTMADSSIVYNEPLYTDSGEIENIQPQAFRVHAMAGMRHFYADRDDEEGSLYYSKEYSGVGAIYHSDLQLVRIIPTGGPITAIASLLDKVIVFKSNSIFALDGSGYDATLGESNFSIPWSVSSIIGCVDQRCIARVPAGLVFYASDHRIYLLDTSLRVTVFSSPVEYWMDVLTPVAFVVEPNQGLLHVFTASMDLVYDWNANRWAIWSARAATQAAAIDGVAWWLDAAGNIWRHDDTQWTDNGTRQAMTLETGWIAPAQGQPVRLYRATILGQNLAAHTLRVKWGYDYDPHWVDSRLYNAAALTPFSIADYHGAGLSEAYLGQAYCLRVDPTRPVASAVRLSLCDESGAGDTWSVAALSLVVGMKTGGPRVHTAKVK